MRVMLSVQVIVYRREGYVNSQFIIHNACKGLPFGKKNRARACEDDDDKGIILCYKMLHVCMNRAVVLSIHNYEL